MTYKILYSELAKQDLLNIEILIFSLTQSKETTEKYIRGILTSIENKNMFPKSGIPLMHNDVFTGYYYTIYKKYLSFYRINTTNIVVDRILYGGMDYTKHLLQNL